MPLVRVQLGSLVQQLLKRVVNEDHYMGDVRSSSAFLAASSFACATVRATLELIQATAAESSLASAAQTDKYLAEFSRELLVVPCLSVLLDDQTTSKLRAWPLKEPLLSKYSSVNMALPPSPHPAFLSGHWVLGNLAGLCTSFNVIPLSADASSSPAHTLRALAVYYCTIGQWLHRYFIPGVFKSPRSSSSSMGSGSASSSGGGIVWMRSGVQLVASGVPIMLHEQLLELLSPPHLRAVYTAVLLSYRADVFQMGSAEDKRMVAEALSSSGLRISKQAVIDKAAEQSWLLGGKWASKIGAGLSKMFGLGGQQSKTAADYVEEAQVAKMGSAAGESSAPNSALKSFVQPLPDSPYPVDADALVAVCRLWSNIFPQAALSSPDSRAWKHLSSFVFSSRIADRLWAAADSLGIERFCKQQFSPPLDLTIADGGRGPSCAPVLVSLAAVLKIVLVALDDSELYDHGVRLPCM